MKTIYIEYGIPVPDEVVAQLTQEKEAVMLVVKCPDMVGTHIYVAAGT